MKKSYQSIVKVEFAYNNFEADSIEDYINCVKTQFFEESYEEIKNNNYLGFDEEGIIFAAQCEAQRKFEELPDPDYD